MESKVSQNLQPRSGCLRRESPTLQCESLTLQCESLTLSCELPTLHCERFPYTQQLCAPGTEGTVTAPIS